MYFIRVVKTLPCVAAYMSSISIIAIAIDRYYSKLERTKNAFYTLNKYWSEYKGLRCRKKKCSLLILANPTHPPLQRKIFLVWEIYNKRNETKGWTVDGHPTRPWGKTNILKLKVKLSSLFWHLFFINSSGTVSLSTTTAFRFFTSGMPSWKYNLKVVKFSPQELHILVSQFAHIVEIFSL